MKFIQQWSLRGMSVALIVGVGLGWMIAPQGAVTPSMAQPPDEVLAGLAEGKLPPELQELEERRAEGEAHAPQRSGPRSRDDILAKIRSNKGGPRDWLRANCLLNSRN